jgi:16S rRNA (guanine966-N2)-methyltransferase
MRIVAGRLGGRRLLAPKGLATRPTTERVREALFAILGDLAGLRVVDCYAGSGALGLEALSRGASRVVLVENGRSACKVIRSNVDTLAASEHVRLLPQPLERCRSALRDLGPFDLVLSDPPWPIAQSAALEVAKVLGPQLRPGATMVLGHPARSPVELPESLQLEMIDRRSWGDSGVSFFRRRQAAQRGPDSLKSGTH